MGFRQINCTTGQQQQAALILRQACTDAVARMHGSTLLPHFRAVLDRPSVPHELVDALPCMQRLHCAESQQPASVDKSCAGALNEGLRPSVPVALALKMRAFAAEPSAHHLLLPGACLAAPAGRPPYNSALTQLQSLSATLLLARQGSTSYDEWT